MMGWKWYLGASAGLAIFAWGVACVGCGGVAAILARDPLATIVFGVACVMAGLRIIVNLQAEKDAHK